MYVEAQSSLAASVVHGKVKMLAGSRVYIGFRLSPFIAALLQPFNAPLNERSIPTQGAPALGSQSPFAINAHPLPPTVCHHH